MTAQQLCPPAAPPVRPAPRHRWGRAVGVLAALLVLLAGAGVAALSLFGTRTVEPGSVQREIVRVTAEAVGVDPTDVRCPEGIAVQAGGSFTCTALVEDDAVTYWVHQEDAEGRLTVTHDRLLRLDALERTVADRLSADRGTSVTVDCGPAGRTAVRNTPGQELACTLTDATGGTALTVTVDAGGAVSHGG